LYIKLYEFSGNGTRPDARQLCTIAPVMLADESQQCFSVEVRKYPLFLLSECVHTIGRLGTVSVDTSVKKLARAFFTQSPTLCSRRDPSGQIPIRDPFVGAVGAHRFRVLVPTTLREQVTPLPSDIQTISIHLISPYRYG